MATQIRSSELTTLPTNTIQTVHKRAFHRRDPAIVLHHRIAGTYQLVCQYDWQHKFYIK